MTLDMDYSLRKFTGLLQIVMLVVSSSFILNFLFPAYAMQPLLPEFEPTKHVSSNPNLFVSAENSFFKNYFAGPQVIEVIVIDPDIKRLDQAYGEPVVTINGKRLHMAQATDGNWYAYFADRDQAIAAGNTVVITGKGLNFGGFCNSSSTTSPKAGVNYGETKGFTIARGGFGSFNHTSNGVLTKDNLPACTNTPGTLTAKQMEHVVRENKTLNSNINGFNAGSVYTSLWPIIQLYDFSGFPQTVTVQYDKAGRSQLVNLVFDRIPSSVITPVGNRPDFPRGAEVQLDLIDPQLNIDPTEEDSWTWGTSPRNNTLYYQTFDRNGNPDADGTPAMQNLAGNLTTFMFNHNGLLTFENANGLLAKLQSNGIQKLIPDPSLPPPLNQVDLRTQSITGISLPITLAEVQPNVGIFGDYDTGGIADVKILLKAPRGKSMAMSYNDNSFSLVVKFHTATLTMG